MSFLRSKTFLGILALVIVDFVVIWIWVLHADLAPDSAIAVYIFVPFVFFLNIILAGILVLFKKKNYSLIFLLNAIASSIIMYNLFGYGVEKAIDDIYDSWEFSRNDTLFVIDKANDYQEFSISYSTDLGSSIGFMSGAAKFKGDTLVLSSGYTHMYILKDRLYNFQGLKSPIILTIRH